MIRRLYQGVFKPLFFSLSAETAHTVVAFGLGWLHRHRALRSLLPSVPRDPSLAVHAFGLDFDSPVGLAAGFDKHATLYNALGALGFAFVEVGTITALAQPGNPRPRLFRLPDDRALVNRMGFNNPGADEARKALAAVAPDRVVVGVNLGKSKVTPVESAAEDYAASARALGPHAAYLVLNVSSPNTPGLRALQSVDALRPIVRAVREALGASCPPLLVKIAPDLADEDIDAVADLALDEGLAGLVATNTTIRREGLHTPADTVAALGAGGLSGPPVRARANEVIGRVFRRTRGALTIIGVGGVETADDVWQKLEAGASLVQVYTGFVYQGPTLARDLTVGLRERLVREGLSHVSEVVGRAHGATFRA